MDGHPRHGHRGGNHRHPPDFCKADRLRCVIVLHRRAAYLAQSVATATRYGAGVEDQHSGGVACRIDDLRRAHRGVLDTGATWAGAALDWWHRENAASVVVLTRLRPGRDEVERS